MDQIDDVSITGYLHPDYAASLTEFGLPVELPRSRGWILQRHIPGSPYQDAMGCYPLFACQDWSELQSDLDDLTEELVSLSLVTFPFGDYDLAKLKKCFADLCVPYKDHFVVDLKLTPDSFIDAHHRRNARKALRDLQVEKCEAPAALLNDWLVLYRELIKRRGITGIPAFSETSFRKQLAVPGITCFRAMHDETTEGMLLWYVHDKVASFHLGAYSARGYESLASFGLFSYAIDYFASKGFHWLHLGAGAGAGTDGSAGLTRFKAGWATGVRPAYLCGRVFNQKIYDELVKATGTTSTGYFPAYRAGEFATP